MPVRVPIPGLAQGERALSADTSRYLVRVLRLSAGERFVAFDPDARTEGDATVLEAHPQKTRVRIENVKPASVVANAKLALVYALAKGDKVDAVVRDATELGATHVILSRTERSVVKLDDATGRLGSKLDRWKRVAEQASRQCGRSDPPAIEGVLGWSDALDRAADCEARFCLDPRAKEALGEALHEATSRDASIAFAIGPEGGLSADEIEIAIGKGFLPASLGPFILRTETVAAAVLGAVRVLSAKAVDQ
jgi:16S rRNA (uracil1498-N3)-methyltransferase